MAAKELIETDLQDASDEIYDEYWDFILDVLVDEDGQEN